MRGENRDLPVWYSIRSIPPDAVCCTFFVYAYWMPRTFFLPCRRVLHRSFYNIYNLERFMMEWDPPHTSLDERLAHKHAVLDFRHNIPPVVLPD